ncbi:amidase domain-containing protein [Pelosinus sp. IPA-1]|uniref:amidase domain-containing protein n=1 Tax=Pelosinus sp. IPA-1 TaxID=3029569 RepID=UPI0024362554|nr:amidase domain-containing protein [Pelosinus sp. IPA-1]GMA98227.1 hypothetical protein PIPA1_10270 [Pelosinus sp. IPA-1]
MVTWDDAKKSWEQGKEEAKRDLFHARHSFDPQPATFAFCRNDAVYYARKYYLNRNPQYPYYDGHDCTNFVSQCWTYAGIPAKEDWFCDGYAVTHSWTWVSEFANYMVNQGYARISYSSLDANLGDVVQLYHPDLGGWHHSAIITKIDEDGSLYYTAHSNSYIDKKLSLIYPDSGDELRFLCPYNAY